MKKWWSFICTVIGFCAGKEIDMEKLLAHISTEDGQRVEHLLKDHCEHSAGYAAECSKDCGFSTVAYLSGLLHDLGKGTKVFNMYIESAYRGEKVRRGSVNHTFAGCIYALELEDKDDSLDELDVKLTREIVAYAIGAHHGLFDCKDLKGDFGFLHRYSRKEKPDIHYEEAVENYEKYVCPKAKIEELFHSAVLEVKCFREKLAVQNLKYSEKCFQYGILVRLIVSAVIEGDRRDTAEFFSKDRNSFYISSNEWDGTIQYFNNKIDKFKADTKLNEVRKYISDQCCIRAKDKAGIYQLNVPTGAGKTLSTLRYALNHAKLHHKKRIIFVIPLLSVLEQNAKIIKEYTGNHVYVLEHHSNLLQYEMDTDELDQYELLKENWNAPIIVTTMYQLLMTLFSSDTAAIRRMHALINSVIAIDEIQSIPTKVVNMFNHMMNFLAYQGESSILLSSATQPRFDVVSVPLKFCENTNVVQLTEEQKKYFERSEVLDMHPEMIRKGMDFDEIVDLCNTQINMSRSVLIITNKKGQAKQLYEAIKRDFDKEQILLYQLSTAMCQNHREKALEEILSNLVAVQQGEIDKTVVCVSTQLVEAGVDFSFQTVIRYQAGIENLVQSAGRCNRSFEYGEKGNVFQIKLKGETLKKLPEIELAQKALDSVVCKWYKGKLGEGSLLSEPIINAYYKKLYSKSEIKACMNYPYSHKEYYQGNLLELLSDSKEFSGKYCINQAFKTAGDAFQVFDEQKIDIIVPYKEGRIIIESLLSRQAKYDLSYYRELLKKAQKFSVSVFNYEAKLLKDMGMLYSDDEKRFLFLKESAYSEEYGVSFHDELKDEFLSY